MNADEMTEEEIVRFVATLKRARERGDEGRTAVVRAADLGAVIDGWLTALHERDEARAEVGRLAPRQRAGQAVFNALARVDPEFADRVRGTELDPFHDDARIAGMLAWWRDVLTGAEAAAEGRGARALVAQREAVAAEREACAAICDAAGDAAEVERDACCDDRSRSLHAGRMHGADECARAIRARGATDGAR